MLEAFIAHKFSDFTVAGKPIRRLDEPTVNALRSPADTVQPRP
jgi:hypothetical protein